MEPKMPTGNNVNWTLAVGMIVTLASYFGIVVPENVQNSLTDLVAALPVIIAAVTTIVAFVQHNIINKPANLAKAKEMAAYYVDKSRNENMRIVPALVLCLAFGFGVSGCALFGGGTTNAGFTALGDADLVAGGAQQGLIALCGIGGVPPAGAPSQCSDPNLQAQIKKADSAMVGCFGDALSVAQASGSSQTQIEAAVTSALACYATFNGLYQPVQKASTRKKIDPTTIITIVETALQVGLDLYNEIMGLNSQSGGVTITQLEQMQATLVANDAIIQAW